MTTETAAFAPRLALRELRPELYEAMLGLETAVARSGLDRTLLELVKIRASQINGCGHCLDMHTKDARARGEMEQRIYGLPAWRECPFYSDAERAALALTEAITLVHEGHVPDDVYAEAARQFDEQTLAALIWAVVAINSWNRVAITARALPGSYRPELAR
jgi:AhpD family alkylhydroperoxidase